MNTLPKEIEIIVYKYLHSDIWDSVTKEYYKSIGRYWDDDAYRFHESEFGIAMYRVQLRKVKQTKKSFQYFLVWTEFSYGIPSVSEDIGDIFCLGKRVAPLPKNY